MPDGTVQDQPNELERLARARFPDPPLSEAEEKLVRAAPKGEFAFCGPNANWDDPANDPSKADADWKEDRNIRADLIRWLCVDRQAKELVDPSGIQALGAKISDSIDLDNVTIPFRLALVRCRLMQGLTLRGAQMPVLSLPGTRASTITADGVVVKGNVFLREGFHAEGEVRFLGARIRGNLECDGATFENPSGTALVADGAVVKGGVFLRNGFTAKGTVKLPGVQIGTNLDCSGATLETPPQSEVENSGTALSADGAVVKGDVFLTDGFSANGTVRLPGIQIGGDLGCKGTKISGTLTAQSAVIKGTFFWLDSNPKETMLDLMDASAGTLVDDARSWPAPGNLVLDGFVYGRISGNAPKDVTSRLDWLDRQEPFTPQPYRQLAKVLRDEGDDAGARKVLHEMERLRRAEQARRWNVPPVQNILLRSRLYVWRRVMVPIWSFILRWTIGYGYNPGRALVGLLILAILGWPLFRYGYFSGNIAPIDRHAYCGFHTDHIPPAYYEHFYASIYSLEKTFPLIKLGQVDLWQPDPNPPSPNAATASLPHRFARWFISAEFLRCLGWCQTVLGWILATLFAAGVTGVVRND